MMSDPLGPVVITVREIYDQVVLVRQHLERLTSQHTDQARDLQDHEDRIRSLEKGRWPLASLNALVAIAALVLALLPMLKR